MIFKISINKNNFVLESITLFNYSLKEAKEYAFTLSQKYESFDIVLEQCEKDKKCTSSETFMEDGKTTVKLLT